ncbi:MAG TPA: thioredoxin domain-containing protein [Stellaceae bacterium]|nr:thioredoxin domain-containing protein [Stellaceae bacterium]
MASSEPAAPQPRRNALGAETSPYLLQHKDNPVAWQAWGPAAFEAAKREDKPILLSIGYAACHWCHVMAHESFERPEIALLMNEHFINIKVDREERPDVDTIYQHALALLGEQGGWPLTMFLTPEREPFWGGTYFPPEPRWGRPGFPQVLAALANAYRSDRAAVTKNVTAMTEALAKLANPTAGSGISLELTDRIAERLVGEIDGENGGIGDAPKFPQASLLSVMWRGYRRTGSAAMRNAVLLTLDHICQGGIYDHLGGGFARYAVDRRWLVPHFEKMLYDNAQLLELLTHAWQATGKPLYAERIAETIGWLAREMLQPEGGFASSLDADSEHEEGKFYVWHEREIDALLGARATRFKDFYDVTPAGNWEGHTILNRLGRLECADDATERALAEDRTALLKARGGRVRPGLDDKVLADWNGLMIAALAYAGQVFGRADWIALAENAFDFIERRMTDEEGRLHHSYRDGRARHPATLDDHANLARAALALEEATGKSAYRERAESWAELVEHWYGDAAGGYFVAASDTENLITRPKMVQDAATPSGNGTMVEVLARLFHLTGKPAYRERAEAAVNAFAGDVPRNFFPFGSLLNGNETLQRAVEIVIMGERGEASTAALLAAVNGVSLPTRVLAVLPPGTALPEHHPAAGKQQSAGRATAYVCRGQTCSLPIIDAAALTAELDR